MDCTEHPRRTEIAPRSQSPLSPRFALDEGGSQALAVTRHLNGDRTAVRLASVGIALRGLIQLLDGVPVTGGSVPD